MNNNNNDRLKDLKLDMQPDVAKGVYSNLAIVAHTPTEITLDFAQLLPGSSIGNVRTRVIMNPIHAKRLLHALAENLRAYENNFGTIQDPRGVKILGDTVPYDILGKA